MSEKTVEIDMWELADLRTRARGADKASRRTSALQLAISARVYEFEPAEQTIARAEVYLEFIEGPTWKPPTDIVDAVATS